MKKVGVKTQVIPEVGDLLKPSNFFSVTNLDDVAGCLKYQGKSKLLRIWIMQFANGVEEYWHDCS